MNLCLVGVGATVAAGAGACVAAGAGGGVALGASVVGAAVAAGAAVGAGACVGIGVDTGAAGVGVSSSSPPHATITSSNPPITANIVKIFQVVGLHALTISTPNQIILGCHTARRD